MWPVYDSRNRDEEAARKFAAADALIAHKPSFQMGRNCVYVSIIKPSD